MRFLTLLLLPQRYKFSSKSQLGSKYYHTQNSCCCYRKGTNFQANHNQRCASMRTSVVVVATAKVQIFKQITTHDRGTFKVRVLLLLPQRYKFSSKSQPCLQAVYCWLCCCCYRKGTNFQANHNRCCASTRKPWVVVATAKVQIFKQITTRLDGLLAAVLLLLLPQRYKFSSKSQRYPVPFGKQLSCCCYRKGTNFQANHNTSSMPSMRSWLLLLPQRYKFSSKSQQRWR